MTLRRRALLAAPLLLAAPPLLAAEARDGPPVAVPGADGAVALTWAGRGAVLLPPGASPLAPLVLSGITLLPVAVPLGPELTLLALCGGERPLVLALEVLRWRRADGGHLETRLTTVTDGRRLRLARLAALPRDRLRWQRAEWTDYLAWQPPRLVDAPVRPPLAGSWQARLAALRRAGEDWLATPRSALTRADLAALGYGGGGADLF